MIDEKKLIEEIKSLTVTITGLRAGKGILQEYAKHFKEAVLRSIEEQPRLGEWILCSERMPEREKGLTSEPEVLGALVFNGDDFKTEHWEVVEYNTVEKVFCEHLSGEPLKDRTVVKWMPLPEL